MSVVTTLREDMAHAERLTVLALTSAMSWSRRSSRWARAGNLELAGQAYRYALDRYDDAHVYTRIAAQKHHTTEPKP